MTKTVYVFLSSSFADMHRERDCISRLCIPNINRELKSRSIEVKTIDLRWGIDTTSLEQERERLRKVMKVCLQEINRCRPFFVGILGHRYGTVLDWENWNDFRKKDRKGKLPETPRSITEAEIYLGGIDSKESMKNSLFFFRDPASYEGMDPKEKKYCYQEEHLEKIQNLEKSIRKALTEAGCGNQAVSYKADLKNCPLNFSDLKDFMDAFEGFVLSHIKDAVKSEDGDDVLLNWIEKENARFIGNTRFRDFVWRKLTARRRIIVLTGESGSGKSTLFATLHHSLEHHQDNAVCFSYSVGLTAEHSSSSHMLSLWMAKARLRFPFTSGDPDFPSIVKHLASEGYEVYILIDSLDRFGLSKEAQHLPFLADCPAHIFVTALPAAAKEFRIFHYKAMVIPMKPLPRRGAKQLIASVMKEVGKAYPGLADILLKMIRPDNQPAYGSPLWLRQACHALFALEANDFRDMQHRQGQRDDEKIKYYLIDFARQIATTPERLFLQMRQRATEHFSEEFVDTVLGSIALAWPGVNLLDLEQITGGRHQDLELALLMRYFAQVLQENTQAHLLSFTHTVFQEAMEGQLGSEKTRWMHQRLMALRQQQKRSDEFLYHALCAYDDNALISGRHFEVFSLTVLMAFFVRNPEKNIPWFVKAFRYDGTDPLEQMSRQISASRWLGKVPKLRYLISGQCGLSTMNLLDRCLGPLLQEQKVEAGAANIKTLEERLDWLENLVDQDPHAALEGVEGLLKELDDRPKLKADALLIKAKALKGTPKYRAALDETLSYAKSLPEPDKDLIALTWCLMMEHLTAQEGLDAPIQFNRRMRTLMEDMPIYFRNLHLSLRLIDTLMIHCLNVGLPAESLCDYYLQFAHALRKDDPTHPKGLGCILHGNEVLLACSQDEGKCQAALEEICEILTIIRENPTQLGAIPLKGNLTRALDIARRKGLDAKLINCIQAMLNP